MAVDGCGMVMVNGSGHGTNENTLQNCIVLATFVVLHCCTFSMIHSPVASFLFLFVNKLYAAQLYTRSRSILDDALSR